MKNFNFDFNNLSFSQLDQQFEQYIIDSIDEIPRRWQRYIAMNYPNAKVRRLFWLKTNVVLGENTYLPQNITLYDDYTSGIDTEPMVRIGANCSIGPGIFATTMYHSNAVKLREQGIIQKYEKSLPIIIGDEVYLAGFFTITPGVKIGNCCIIGANSLVNKDIPDYSLAYGNPIRIIKDIRK